MIDFSRLRLQNLFPFSASMGPETISPEMFDSTSYNEVAPNVIGEEPQQNPLDLLRQIYQPRTKLSGMLTSELGNMPQREEPGKLRKFGAILAAAGAPAEHKRQIYEQNAYAPYNRQLGDWRQRIDTLMKGATEEDRYNLNQRALALGTVQRGMEQQKVDISRKKEQDIYETKQADMQRKIDEAGKKLELAQSKFESDQSNKQNLLDLHKAQLDAQNARHDLDNAQHTKQLDEMKRFHDLQKENWDRQRTDYETRLGQLDKPSKSADLESQKKIGVFNRATQALAEHPEWAKYIKRAPGNVVSVEMPSMKHPFDWSGSSAEEMKKISDYIFGQQQQQQPQQKPPQAPPGWKYVLKGDKWVAEKE